MTAHPLIVGLGAVTAVGLTAPQSCTAIRAGISGFGDAWWASPIEEPQVGAVVPARSSLKYPYLNWLVNMATRAIRQCMEEENPDPAATALLIAVPEAFRDHPALADTSIQNLLKAINQRLQRPFHAASAVLREGHAAPIRALAIARQLLMRGTVQYCIVGGVDSLINEVDIRRLGAVQRLLGPETSQGLVPGEGAAFLLLTLPGRPLTYRPLGQLLGVGAAMEEDNVLGERYSVGKGLRQALQEAVKDAELPESSIDFLVSDMNGERYRAWEGLIGHARFYRTRRERLDVWYPAASVGDIGAAAGALLVAVATMGIARRYAPGRIAMCEGSSDEGLRAACLVGPLPNGSSYERLKHRSLYGPNPIPVRLRVEKQNTEALSARSMSVSVIPVVVYQHAEEATCLWLLRAAAVNQPHYSLPDLAELDDRVEAHLDGLRVAGEAGWELCKAELSWQEAGEVFTASVIALESGSEAWFYAVLEAGSDSVEQARGMVSALGWISYAQARKYIDRLLAAESAMLRRIGLAAAAIHRQDPGLRLADAIRNTDAGLRARALKAAGELGRRDLLNALHPHMRAEEKTCQFYAAWSAARLGDDYAVKALMEMVEVGSPYEQKALDLALRRLPLPKALDVIRWLDAQPERRRLAVVGAGVAGDPALVPRLIEKMAVPELARVAGEAFTNITGVDLAYEDLEGKWPEGFEAGPTEDPEDENVEMDWDEDLPWPDPALVVAWWHAHASKFRQGTRYFLGRPLSEPVLQEALRTGKQRQRAAAALELALLHPNQPLFETRAPGFKQQQMLGLKPV